MIITKMNLSLNQFALHLRDSRNVPKKDAFRYAKMFRHLCIQGKRAGKKEAKRILKECKRHD